MVPSIYIRLVVPVRDAIKGDLIHAGAGGGTALAAVEGARDIVAEEAMEDSRSPE